MKTTEAIHKLQMQDQRGYYVYSTNDFQVLFSQDSARALKATLQRLVNTGMLERVSKGIYVYVLSKHKFDRTIERIAKVIRRGEYNYISLESALSEWGAISQVPVDRITVMTTGRSGEYSTPYGIIEFTHTKRNILDILSKTTHSDRPLRFATESTATRDLIRVGRNVHLLEESTFENQP
jgi:predicted transcriptional regulator of viral defense system